MMVSAIIEMGADIINVFATSIFPSFIIKIYSLVFIMLLPYPFVRALRSITFHQLSCKIFRAISIIITLQTLAQH